MLLRYYISSSLADALYLLIAVVSIGYGVEYGSDYDNYDLMKSPMSKSEILLVIMLFSHIFFELGKTESLQFIYY
jgi:hypothetical protein